MEFATPMMKQYQKIKLEYPNCLLFFRLGDFYELFLDDAKIGSLVMDITLTSRRKGKDGQVPMCGVPFHALESYLGKLVKAGYKVAICEQTSKPSKDKDIVDREVVRIVTPGTITNENLLDRKSNNYIATFFYSRSAMCIAYCDLSTGEITIMSKDILETNSIYQDIKEDIKNVSPSEVVLMTAYYNNPNLVKAIKDAGVKSVFTHQVQETSHKERVKHLKSFFNVVKLSVYGNSLESPEAVQCLDFLILYLSYTQKGNLGHIKSLKTMDSKNYMILDASTVTNLELFGSLNVFGDSNNSCLFTVLDQTKTSMGARNLKRWLLRPLINGDEIKTRQNAITFLINKPKVKEGVANKLDGLLDFERILSRIAVKSAGPRDLIGLKVSLMRAMASLDMANPSVALRNAVVEGVSISILQCIRECKKAVKLIGKNIIDDPPVSSKQGGLIKDNVNSKLDDIKSSIEESKKWIARLEEKERQRTNNSKLKVGYNSVFGYFIEVSKASSNSVPSNYVRKQTLVSSERYITEELKYHEQIVLSAEEKINELEYELFVKIVDDVTAFSNEIQALARFTANLDSLNSLATVAKSNFYVKPTIRSGYELKLLEARHPVVESILDAGEFTPNSIKMDTNGYVHLITGPNMAGKSTYIRQVALIQIMAQIGSFVPAYQASVSIVDGIYTRIGASDILSEGLSTFMVEMIETAKILNNATSSSLVILDEVGRGTSTSDGLSIAKAVVEYLHDVIKAKTLFATHFHELINLEQSLTGIENYNVQVHEESGEIKFLHKLEKGGTDKSYGIEVAKLAGVPEKVIKRAKEILSKVSSKQMRLDI